MRKLMAVWTGVRQFFIVLFIRDENPELRRFREDSIRRQRERLAAEEDDGVVGVYDKDGRPVARTKPISAPTGIPYGVVEEPIEVQRPGTGGTAYEWGPRS